MKNNSRSVIVK